MVTKNTICSKHGHLLDESNASHSCSSVVCGANLPMQHTIGDEYTWAKHTIGDDYTWASEGDGRPPLSGWGEVKEVTTE